MESGTKIAKALKVCLERFKTRAGGGARGKFVSDTLFHGGSRTVVELRTRSCTALCAMLDARILDTCLARLCGGECVKATFHLTIFDILMRPMREDQRHRRRFVR